jgi:hypothetical protein
MRLAGWHQDAWVVGGPLAVKVSRSNTRAADHRVVAKPPASTPSLINPSNLLDCIRGTVAEYPSKSCGDPTLRFIIR